MKNTILVNSPFQCEKKFIYRNILIQKHKSINTNTEKTLSFYKPIKSISSIKNLRSSHSQSDILSKNNIKNVIVCYKFPKLKLPKKNIINKEKVPLSEKREPLKKKENKLRSSNRYLSLIKPENPFLSKLIKKNDLNNVLGIKNERSSIIKFLEKKKEIDSKKYIQKLGVMKYIDKPILKQFNIGNMDNTKENISNKKQIKEYSKTMNLKDKIKKIVNKKRFEYKNSLKYSLSRSYDYLLHKKKIKENKQLEEKNEKRVDKMRAQRLSMLQKQIYQYNEVYRDITRKMNNFYNKKRKEFEKYIENEFPKEEEQKN